MWQLCGDVVVVSGSISMIPGLCTGFVIDSSIFRAICGAFGTLVNDSCLMKYTCHCRKFQLEFQGKGDGSQMLSVVQGDENCCLDHSSLPSYNDWHGIVMDLAFNQYYIVTSDYPWFVKNSNGNPSPITQVVLCSQIFCSQFGFVRASFVHFMVFWAHS